MSSDRIEKEVTLRAPLDRVWRAIANADEFGRWFGVRFDGPFVAGESVTGVITPTEVDDDVADEIRQLAIRAFDAIDGQGLARVDFFLTEDGPVVNEINTMPGFTTISMYPRMWAASGVDYPTLLATMVDTALARGTGLR